MKKKLTILCAVAVMICTCLTGCGVNAGKIRFGSAGIGGTYQIFGDTFANLVTSKSKNYNIEVKTTAGSAANLRLLSKDYIQMAVAQMDLINDAYERTGIFENDKKYQGYSAIASLYTEACQIVVPADSSIHSIEDLEGKTIAVQTTTRPEKIFLSKTDERIPAIRSLIALQKRELIYPFLSKGYADALAAHETAIRQYMEDYNIKFRILDEPLETVGLGVAFDKNDDRGIEKQLTEILNQMRNDGTEKKIISRYIPDADKYLEVDSYGK